MKRATYEDVLNAPEHKVAEILDGELFLSPMLAVVRVEPFEAIELELGSLWADPPLRP